MAAADHLVGDGRAQKADGRADTGIGRHDDASDAELLRDRAAWSGAAPPKAIRVCSADLAALHRMNAGGIRHVLVDDLATP